jgi:hypothetical protein
MTELTPQQLKERHQEKMVKDLVRTSDKWAKEHGINLKDIPPDEPLTREKPVVKYVYNKKSGLRYKRTLLATIRGDEARALQERNMDHTLYWSYDTKKNTLEIYDEKMTTPLD